MSEPTPKPRRAVWVLWDGGKGERVVLAGEHVEPQILRGETWRQVGPVMLQEGIRDRALLAMAHELRRLRP